MVDIALFSIHDLVQLSSASFSLIFVVLIMGCCRYQYAEQQCWLPFFFFLFAITLVQSLNSAFAKIGAPPYIPENARGYAVFLSVIINGAQCLFCYWLARLVVFGKISFAAGGALYFTGLAGYALVFFLCYQFFGMDKFPVASGREFLVDTFVVIQQVILFIGGCLCAYSLYRYTAAERRTYVLFDARSTFFLSLVLVVSLLVNILEVIEVFAFHFFNEPVFTSINYIIVFSHFFLCSSLFLLLLSVIKKNHDHASRPVENVILEKSIIEPRQQLIEKLCSYMETNKPYLESHITVERLAARLSVSPRLLSGVINNQLQKNFFELIGSYRIEEAKKNLANERLHHMPISEIMKNCGFNSKSVFNQAFKKSVGVTPSHYRRRCLKGNLAN